LAVIFVNKVESSLVEKKLYYKLAKYGISYKQVVELRNRYGKNTVKELDQNPYNALAFVNIPFSAVDSYAKDNGFEYTDLNRIRAFSTEMAKFIAENGHSYITLDEYTRLFRIKEDLLSAYTEQIPDTLIKWGAFSSGALLNEKMDDHFIIGNKKAKEIETEIVSRLKAIKKAEKELIPQRYIDMYKKDCKLLDDCQKKMLDTLGSTDACFLIGGPGTGKTTTINKIIDMFKHYYPGKSYALCAPSGRAAQNIKEATGEESMTIHLLLEYCFIGDKAEPRRNAENPLDADLIIIDEFSMVGINLFLNLLKAVKDDAKIIMVGDWNQLMSIEPGNLLKDMVLSGQFRNVVLTQIHRQAGNSRIVKNSKKILDGDSAFELGEDFEIINCSNNEEGKLKLKELFFKNYNRSVINDTLVISPSTSNDYGCEMINSMLQESLHDTSEPYVIFGENIFFENDRIMTTINRYGDSPYYNGDLWSLKNINSETSVDIESKDGLVQTIADEQLEDIALAYALSVHKCQGSEANTCILFLPDNIPRQLVHRSLLYTAITRAKKKCIIINVNDALGRYASSPICEIRRSYIPNLLKIDYKNFDKCA
jgi:exodeoxyribonuclease V alpha subunit